MKKDSEKKKKIGRKGWKNGWRGRHADKRSAVFLLLTYKAEWREKMGDTDLDGQWETFPQNVFELLQSNKINAW